MWKNNPQSTSLEEPLWSHTNAYVKTQCYCTIPPLDVSHTTTARGGVYSLAGKFILTMQIVSIPFVTASTSPHIPTARADSPTQTYTHRDLS